MKEGGSPAQQLRQYATCGLTLLYVHACQDEYSNTVGLTMPLREAQTPMRLPKTPSETRQTHSPEEKRPLSVLGSSRKSLPDIIEGSSLPQR